MGSLKQVILIRRDLNMRRGKEIAQGSHASMDFIVERVRNRLPGSRTSEVSIHFSEVEKNWISGGMAKICLQVGSEEELMMIYKKAVDAGLEARIIRDSGKTEFGGKPTVTSLAIGPADSESIDAITGHLTLY